VGGAVTSQVQRIGLRLQELQRLCQSANDNEIIALQIRAAVTGCDAADKDCQLATRDER